MDLKRGVVDRMALLLVLGNIATAIALSGVNNELIQSLECTNDMNQSMFCKFEAQNCHEYDVTLHYIEEVRCISEQCDSGRCCCSAQMIIILGEIHTATVKRGSQSMGSKSISIEKTIKPRVPKNISVKPSNGNFQVTWSSNMKNERNLNATVTYHKKGSTEKVSESIIPNHVDGLNYYDILGRHLESSTTYIVSVKSQSYFSGLFSDSSEEVKFITPASHETLVMAIIISLSIAAIIFTGAIYGCYLRLKAKWWDTVPECPNPKLLNMLPSGHKALTSMQPIISRVSVEPLIPEDSKLWSKESLRDTSSGSHQQSSGISTGSSCLSYAITEPAVITPRVQDALDKVFASISPISPLTINPLTAPNVTPYNLCDVRAEGMTSGSSCFDNKTYTIHLPSFPHQITADSSEGQGSGVSPSMSTDMSYQQCNADSGRFSCAEDSNLPSISSGINTAASCDHVEAGDQCTDEVVSGAKKPNGESGEVIKVDENPCYGCMPAGSCSFPLVSDEYQSFQSVVQEPDVLFSSQRRGEDSFTTMPQSHLSPFVPGFIENVQGGQCPSDHERTLFSVISADQFMPVITDSSYQCV